MMLYSISLNQLIINISTSLSIKSNQTIIMFQNTKRVSPKSTREIITNIRIKRVVTIKLIIMTSSITAGF